MLRRRALPERGSGTEHFEWLAVAAYEPRLSAGFSASERGGSVAVALRGWKNSSVGFRLRARPLAGESNRETVNRGYIITWALSRPPRL